MRLDMDIKTKRILMQSLKNLGRLIAFASVVIAYSLTCLWASHTFTGDIYFGLVALFLPMLLFAVWDMSRSQVESQIYNEEQTIEALKREY